jgi:hypothetical protein
VTVDADTRIPDSKHIRALWTGLLLPPLALLANLEIAYALVPSACSRGSTVSLHLVHVASLLLVAGAGLTAWHTWAAVGLGWSEGAGGRVARSRLLAGLGVLVSGLCGLLILAQWIPVLILHPCQ